MPTDVEDRHGRRRGLIQNLGVGGVFVAAERPDHPGDLVVLRFALPGLSEPLLVEAEIRWIRDPRLSEDGRGSGMGLKFAKLSTYAAAPIDASLRDRARTE